MRAVETTPADALNAGEESSSAFVWLVSLVPPVLPVSHHDPWPLSHEREGQGQATTPVPSLFLIAVYLYVHNHGMISPEETGNLPTWI